MEAFLAFFVTVLGLIVGSFVNVLVLRYGTGKTLMGRSACFSCGTVLSARELIPVLSYLLQRGRCRTCGSRISLQYPLVELSAGILFLLLHLKFFSGEVTLVYIARFGFFALIMALLLAILVYDLKHKIIPDGLVYGAAALSFAALFVDFGELALTTPPLTALVAGPALALPFALLWLISRGRWLGLGDGKLALPLGWVLGLSLGATAVLLAFWAGALISVTLLALQRASRAGAGTSVLSRALPALTMKSEVPFAPFLIASFWFVFFTGFDLFSYLALT